MNKYPQIWIMTTDIKLKLLAVFKANFQEKTKKKHDFPYDFVKIFLKLVFQSNYRYYLICLQ